MYPMEKDFSPIIDQFLLQLHKIPNLKVQTNNMSTQVFGKAEVLFPTIQELIMDTYKNIEQCPFVIKVLKTDVSEKNIPNY